MGPYPAAHRRAEAHAFVPRVVPGADDGGNGIPTNTIIAAVCGSVGGFVLVLFLWRALVRLRIFRRRTVPLPPVQPLAHHRELHRSTLSVRKHSPSPPEIRSVPETLTPTGSAVSLMRPGPSPQPSGWEHGSVLTREADGDEASDMLHPPMRPFLENPRLSRQSASTESGASTVSLSSEPTPPGSPPLSAASSSSGRLHPNRSRSRPSRAPSLVSHGSAVRRGPPHKRSSQMQIMMPAPLAPQLYHGRSASIDGADTLTMRQRHGPFAESAVDVADSWITSPSRSTLPRERTQSTGSSTGRPSFSSTWKQRSMSLGPAQSHSSFSTGTSSVAPELPSMPTVVPYPTFDSSPDEADETIRGRSRAATVVSLALPSSSQTVAVRS